MQTHTKDMQKIYVLVSKDKNEIQKLSAQAAKSLSSIIKSCLGPRAMQKIILTKINSIEITNDGNSILRELDIGHPAVKCLVELSKTQDNECGDGTTSVLIFAAELLSRMVKLLEKNHPVKISRLLSLVKEYSLEGLETSSQTVEKNEIFKVVQGSVATKLCSLLKLPVPEIVLDTINVLRGSGEPKKHIDIKTDIKIEKIVGTASMLEKIDGVLIEKELVHTQMRKKIKNPRIVLLDTPIEYKKGESVTNLEYSKSGNIGRTLEIEEEQIREMCKTILDVNPDLVFTEKGICDLALSIFQDNGITAVRRIKKGDSIRLSKSTGATIVNRIEDLHENHVGTAGLFEYTKMNKSYYCKISGCKNPGAVTIILHGPSSDFLMEIERNLMDGLKVAWNIMQNPKMVPGGGAVEMAISAHIKKWADKEYHESKEKNVGDFDLLKKILHEAAEAFKIISITLARNTGNANVVEVISKLEKLHMENKKHCGVNGITGEINDMRGLIMEPIFVKSQLIKSAFDAVMQLLRVDCIVETKNKGAKD